MVSGGLILEARKRAGLTQAELGRRVGRPQSVIGRWERGEVLPSLETLRKLIRACGLELTFGIAERDDSYVAQIERMMRMTPAERVARSVATTRTLTALRRRLTEARGA